jgi:hypothetical protein
MLRTWCRRGIAVAVIASATPASADCSALAAPASATEPRPGIAAKISMASCQAEAALAALHITPDDAGAAAIVAATKPSFDLFDAAIQAGDSTLTPIAREARADLLVGMAVRLRASAAPMTMEHLAQATADHAAIEPKVKPWLDQAQAKAP